MGEAYMQIDAPPQLGPLCDIADRTRLRTLPAASDVHFGRLNLVAENSLHPLGQRFDLGFFNSSRLRLSISSPTSNTSLVINSLLSVEVLGLLHGVPIHGVQHVKGLQTLLSQMSCAAAAVAAAGSISGSGHGYLLDSAVWLSCHPSRNFGLDVSAFALSCLELKSQHIATSCCTSSTFSSVVLTYLHCYGVLRENCFAACLCAKICHVFLTLDSAHPQYFRPDFVLNLQICHIYFGRQMPCLWRLCSVVFASAAGACFTSYPGSHSIDTVPFDSHAPSAAARNSDSALHLAMIFCLRVDAFNM